VKEDCTAALELDPFFAAEAAKQMAARLQSDDGNHPYEATAFECDESDTDYFPSESDSGSDPDLTWKWMIQRKETLVQSGR